ncbi:MAG: hypothetical protein E6I97_15255 [Chloroflexi bacterium]|nr:MAG: hypothetical protein E6I97_15255 [Chloroflexota bacterium]
MAKPCWGEEVRHLAREGKCVAWKKGPSRDRTRSSGACFPWQAQLSKKRDIIAIMFPREVLQHSPLD